MHYTEEEVAGVTEAVIDLAELALIFGRIDRTGPQHPNGMPESDTDHTVMLGWIAPALADLVNKKVRFLRHNVGKVAQYALVHDAVEVYAGDTPTVRISEEELQDKEMREAQASAKLNAQFRDRLPWFAKFVRLYELQQDPDARFVRSVDKLMPKLVHVVCAGRDLVRSGFTLGDFESVVARQRKQIEAWCPDQLLLAIYDRVVKEVRGAWPSDPAPSLPQPPAERHWINMGIVGRMLCHANCAHEATEVTCPYTVAFEMCKQGYAEWPEAIMQVGAQGDYPVVLDERGLLNSEE
jgi:putative hydrolase of HD superfamily